MAQKHTPIHLRPHARVAERVLVPGDPGRALRLAQALIDGPRMLNHHRGLWGYSGPAKADGRPLTVQSSGLGGPSAAAVLADLAALGARRLVRVGTCRGLEEDLEPGDLLLAARVLTADGAAVEPDRDLTAQLGQALPGARRVTVASVDFAHLGAPPGAGARDMTSAGLLGAARRCGVAAAVVLAVAAAGERALGDDGLHAAEAALGSAAVDALAA